MTAKDYTDLQALFEKLDPTGEGFIPATDLQGALEKAGKKTSTEVPPARRACPRARQVPLGGLFSHACPDDTGRQSRLEISRQTDRWQDQL